MRYAVFADIHSNLEALERVLGVYASESIEQYIFLGDAVGYSVDPVPCIQRIRSLPLTAVAGNHDQAAVNLFSVDNFSPEAREAIFWTRRNLDEDSKQFLESLKLTFQNHDFTMVHGTLNSPQDFNYMEDGFIAEETFRLMKTPLCFIGHTHVAGVFIKDKEDHICYRENASVDIEAENKYIINVGSVGQPRDGNPAASYCIYDSQAKKVTLKRIDYDIAVAQKKIVDAGLPELLGHRLFMGR
ncbi:MAG: metallophosphoesterase family protein [Candidatus Pacebacteria bacterium]|nr:metallophosphoesterase family protein [Candidatus Paceibacterota bacterium]